MFFKKRKLSGDEIAKKTNQDNEKKDWIVKILNEREAFHFVLSLRSSLFYTKILDQKEPTRKRTTAEKQIIHQFKSEVAQIIQQHEQVESSKRTQQIEQLILQSDFSDDYRYTHQIYYHFVDFTDEERREWRQKMKRLSRLFFGDIID